MNMTTTKWPSGNGRTKLLTRLIYLIAAAFFIALAVLSLCVTQPENTAPNEVRQQAGAAANGYQKPGAAVRMFFTLPTDLQPGGSGVIHTTWLVDEAVEVMTIAINGDNGLNFTAPELVTIAAPTVGFEYTLDIPFTAAAGLHTLGFISSTSTGNRSQSRSFGIAVEAGDPLPVQRKSASVASTETGEKLHRMAAARY